MATEEIQACHGLDTRDDYGRNPFFASAPSEYDYAVAMKSVELIKGVGCGFAKAYRGFGRQRKRGHV